MGNNPFWTTVQDCVDKYKKDASICKVVCAWCPDKEKKEKLAKSEGNGVSHGVCEACAKKHFE